MESIFTQKNLHSNFLRSWDGHTIPLLTSVRNGRTNVRFCSSRGYEIPSCGSMSG